MLGDSNLWRPRSWLLDFTALSMFVCLHISELLACGVLAVHARGRALCDSSGSLVLQITYCVHDNANKYYFVLVVFTIK